MRQMLEERHKRARVQFAGWMLISERIVNLIFSDESRFCLTSDRRWVWKRRGDYNDKFFADKERFPLAIMIFGAIGLSFKSKLIICEDSIDAARYVRNLEESEVFERADEVFGLRNYVFQQDRAPCHTAMSSKNWMRFRTPAGGKLMPSSGIGARTSDMRCMSPRRKGRIDSP